MNLEKYFLGKRKKIDKALDKFLPAEKTFPARIHQAMRHSVFNGGKRIRPILVLAASRLCGGGEKEALTPACAVELIHAYSLVHDDLPSMDNADERRGKPSCHKKFGEATAVLAGDALLTLAFEILAKGNGKKSSFEIIREVSASIGSQGMVGGQMADILSENGRPTQSMIDFISVNKTGQLIRASCVLGAVSAGATKSQKRRISRYGEHLGFAFQIIDDIIDGNGYVNVVSPNEAYRRAEELVKQAKDELKPFGRKADKLRRIADFILERRK